MILCTPDAIVLMGQERGVTMITKETEAMLGRIKEATDAVRIMEVGHLLTKAHRALAQLDFAEASKLCREALTFDPANREAGLILNNLKEGG